MNSSSHRAAAPRLIPKGERTRRCVRKTSFADSSPGSKRRSARPDTRSPVSMKMRMIAASCTRWRGGPASVALALTSTTEDRVHVSPITDAALPLTGTQVAWSAKQTEVTRQAVLDLCHVIAR